ncbi:hypothetical protein DPSP01_011442 [Paraphaeosphaeria sporulosa]
MHNLLLPLLALPLLTHAALNGHCTGSEDFFYDGICVKTSTCASYGGTTISGHCPNDPADVKCCYVNTCDHSHPQGYSYCAWTNHPCPLGNPGSGFFKSSKWLRYSKFLKGP